MKHLKKHKNLICPSTDYARTMLIFNKTKVMKIFKDHCFAVVFETFRHSSINYDLITHFSFSSSLLNFNHKFYFCYN